VGSHETPPLDPGGTRHSPSTKSSDHSPTTMRAIRRSRPYPSALHKCFASQATRPAPSSRTGSSTPLKTSAVTRTSSAPYRKLQPHDRGTRCHIARTPTRLVFCPPHLHAEQQGAGRHLAPSAFVERQASARQSPLGRPDDRRPLERSSHAELGCLRTRSGEPLGIPFRVLVPVSDTRYVDSESESRPIVSVRHDFDLPGAAPAPRA
jgi:hypothetical protein